MLVTEELSDVFRQKSCFSFYKKANVKLHKEEGLILEDHSKSCFNKKKPLVISYQFILAVETHITQSEQNDSMDIRFLGSHSKNTQKVFDKTLEFHSAASPVTVPLRKAITFEDQLIITYVHCQGNKWSIATLELKHDQHEIIAKWKNSLNHILEKIKQIYKRPSKLLIFINPFGGKGEASRIHNNQVQPLFKKFNIDSEVIITERANHARDYLQDCNLEGIDGVICIGGDGMFAEIFNGILRRSGMESGMCNDNSDSQFLASKKLVRPKWRVGVIPGGSTDAVATTLHGTNDIITATLHIIIGDDRNVDISSICNGEGRLLRFSSMISYGYFGDLMSRSESYRWLGPRRYDISGVRTFLGNRGYNCSISYKEAEGSSFDIHDQCLSDCSVCQNTSKNSQDNQNDKSTADDTIEARKPDTEARQNGIEARQNGIEILQNGIEAQQNGIEAQKNGIEDCQNGIEARQNGTEILQNGIEARQNGIEAQQNGIEDCQNGIGARQNGIEARKPDIEARQNGKFTVITSACTRCASRFTPKGLSPGAHLGDGLLDLVFVSKTSRLNYFRYLFRSAYLTSDPFDLPFVHRLKVREFSFTPDTDPNDMNAKTSVWNCDGEILDCPKINVKVHCQMLPVFARGPTVAD